MNHQPRRCVLDASAVLELMLHKPGHNTVAKLLPVATIPASALTETFYVCADKGIPLKRIHKQLADQGAHVESITETDAVRAAQLIAQSRAHKTGPRQLSLGDGLCIAVAERLQLPLVGNDQHWETLKLNVKFWPIH